MSVFADIKKTVGSFALDIQLDAGNEALALLGNSGCGKSMTLRCIAGIDTPDEGVIRINDRTVFDSRRHINLKPQQRGVGYLFQNYALFPSMTVLQNVMAGAERDKSLSKRARRDLAMKQLSDLKLEGLESNYPSQLSGGQQQRVSLARILVSRPDILLLDEPFSALDAALRWETEQVVRATIAGFPGTTILVTHDRDEVYRLSDRLAVFS
ncbi:MAG: ATP-binding cassette domain-containing protein, partial [Oscillospiraceae bacterium]|nr:ATP-binding cassette domain-containing protein [Oscillospiraceae bacterium]